MKNDLLYKTLRHITNDMSWYLDDFIAEFSIDKRVIADWWIKRTEDYETFSVLNSGLAIHAVKTLCKKKKWIDTYDMNPFIHDLAWDIHSSEYFHHATVNTSFDPYLIEPREVVVNTSCECSAPMGSFGEPEMIKVLGGNSATKIGTINRIDSTDQLIDQWNLRHVIETETLDLIDEFDVPYKQHMVIGK